MVLLNEFEHLGEDETVTGQKGRTIFLGRPSESRIAALAGSQTALPFTHEGVGSSGGETPEGYRVDHYRLALGRGGAVWERARHALRRWRQFDLEWIELVPPRPELEVGGIVVVMARLLGLWIVNVNRIVYTVEEDGEVCRFGFAYGTLPAHVEEGEERFLVEWDRRTDGVFYDLRAFSRPRHPLARFASRFARYQQRRFARGSLAGMVRAMGEAR